MFIENRGFINFKRFNLGTEQKNIMSASKTMKSYVPDKI